MQNQRYNRLFRELLKVNCPPMERELDAWLKLFADMEDTLNVSKQTLLDTAKELYIQKKWELVNRSFGMSKYFEAMIKSKIQQHKLNLASEQEAHQVEEYLE